MASQRNRYLRGQVNRRQVLRGSALGLAGLSAAALVGCGDSEESGDNAAPGGGGTANGGTTAATAAAASDVKYGGELVLNQTGDPPSMDPQQSTSNNSTRIARAIYSQLVRYTPNSPDPADLTVVPALAESWENVDPLTWRFSLRGDVHWHDIAPVNGRLLDAEDVKISLDQLRRPDSPVNGVYEPIENIEVVDNTTLVITTKRPYAPFLTMIAEPQTTYIGSKEIFAEDGDLSKRYIGTGPYIFGEYEAGTRLTHTRNDNYWEEGLPRLDRITQVIQNDTSALIAAFTSGQLHAMGATDTVLSQVESLVPDLNKTQIPSSSSQSIAMQNQREPFTDVRVRKAVIRAVNQQRLIAVGHQGSATISGPIPPGIREYVISQDQVEAALAQDVAEAKKLLDADGYADGYDAQMLMVSTGTDAYNSVSELVQQDLAEVGIRINLDVQDQAIGRQRGIDGDFDMYNVAGRITGLEADFFIRDAFYSTSSRNWSFGVDAKLDELILAQSEEVDPDARRELLNQIQLMLLNDLTPELFLPVGQANHVHRAEVKDYFPCINGDRSNETFAWLDV